MVESTRQVQSKDPFDRFDEAVNDPRLYETYERADLAPYGRTELAPYAPTELTPSDQSHEPVPLFLSDYDDDRYKDGREYTFGNGKPLRTFRMSRILAGALVVATAVGGFAVFAMDSTRNVVANSKASLAGVAPVSIGAAPPESTPQQPRVAAVSPVTPEPAVAAPNVQLQAARRSQPDAAAAGGLAAHARKSRRPTRPR